MINAHFVLVSLLDCIGEPQTLDCEPRKFVSREMRNDISGYWKGRVGSHDLKRSLNWTQPVCPLRQIPRCNGGVASRTRGHATKNSAGVAGWLASESEGARVEDLSDLLLAVLERRRRYHTWSLRRRRTCGGWPERGGPSIPEVRQ